VCANCAATLDTHCGRSLPRRRRCQRCGMSFQPRRGESWFCSLSCSKRDQGKGIARPDRRKVDRPDRDQLLADLDSMSVCAVGRKYGVSDNAVRKWLAWYERQRDGSRQSA
jgi:hypothetical protein